MPKSQEAREKIFEFTIKIPIKQQKQLKECQLQMLRNI